jgi:hypothetical protein
LQRPCDYVIISGSRQKEGGERKFSLHIITSIIGDSNTDFEAFSTYLKENVDNSVDDAISTRRRAMRLPLNAKIGDKVPLTFPEFNIGTVTIFIDGEEGTLENLPDVPLSPSSVVTFGGAVDALRDLISRSIICVPRAEATFVDKPEYGGKKKGKKRARVITSITDGEKREKKQKKEKTTCTYVKGTKFLQDVRSIVAGYDSCVFREGDANFVIVDAPADGSGRPCLVTPGLMHQQGCMFSKRRARGGGWYVDYTEFPNSHPCSERKVTVHTIKPCEK